MRFGNEKIRIATLEMTLSNTVPCTFPTPDVIDDNGERSKRESRALSVFEI